MRIDRQIPFLCLLLNLGWPGTAATASETPFSLAGKWRFALDRSDSGISERWFERKLDGTIPFPGSLPERGVGDPVTVNTKWTGGIVDKTFFTSPDYAKYRQPDNIKIPFWLQPETYYAGAAWFQRDFTLPANWRGKRVVLFLERPHWETQVWIDGKIFGTNNSLATPHEYDLGKIAPGKHTLSIRVDNRSVVAIGENSHCISDHTQGNWNGIVGRIELRASPLVWLQEMRVYPDLPNRKVRIQVLATNASGRPFAGKLSFFFEENGKASRLPISRNFNTQETCLTTEDEIELGPAFALWDEFNPAMRTVRADLRGELGGEFVQSELAENYGLREISVDGTQFTINGRKAFLRGTLECCIFPKTGHPPMDRDEWKRIIRVAKAHGLNLIRFHSWCPPEAAFVAADQLGFYFQIETCWANQSITIGDGQPVDAWVYQETDRILSCYGNHPSFLLMPHGNEPGGKNALAYLAKYVAHYKGLDPRRLWTSGSGWPQIPENQFHVTPDPRVQGWGSGLNSRINARPPETTTDYGDYIAARAVPVISHEIGQWCVYPNFKEIQKYTGYLKPRNFEIFRDRLKANGMEDLARQFLLASGKLQTLCYKEDIESALRTRGMGGFELLDLHDFPGQGTALVGVLDPFWEDKGYVTAKEYNRFCNRTVLLARLAKRVFTTDETLEARIEAANFGAQPLPKAELDWKLVQSNGRVFAEGALPPLDISVDNGIRLGALKVELKNARVPERYKLVARLADTEFENDWDVWVYPGKLPAEPAGGILVTSKFDAEAQRRLRSGGKVLLTIPGQQVRNFDREPVKLGFSTIFWNTAWTHRQAPTTLGLLCNPKHPALASFPTEFCSNWQWWYLVHRAGALRLDLLPGGLEPIVRVIDDWFTARSLGLIFEGRVDTGKIVVCGLDLTSGADDPVSRQMRSSLLQYMAGPSFQPTIKLTREQIASLQTEK